MPFHESKEYWYVLFVYDGKEEKVVDSLNSRFKNGEVSPFVPRKDKWFIGRGKKIKERELLFPGYVFIESALADLEFASLTKDFIGTSHDIIRLLRYSDNEISVRHHERKTWLYLLGKEKCIETSVGFIENDRVCIECGPLMGHEGIIKKINRHKREAIIEIEFMGQLIKMSIAIQIIKKI